MGRACVPRPTPFTFSATINLRCNATIRPWPFFAGKAIMKSKPAPSTLPFSPTFFWAVMIAPLKPPQPRGICSRAWAIRAGSLTWKSTWAICITARTASRKLLSCYDRAYEIFLPFADSEGLGIALYNMSVCLISQNDFPRALATYRRAREMFVAHGMTLLIGQADYNIAYLYYLRGEYGRAIAMLRAAREQSELNGDAHILALCYLDLSDIYLELGLSSEAAETAHEGIQRFRKLGMGYEEAKCLANEAIALSQQRKHLRALDSFAGARAIFVREKNQVWPSLIDLYCALALFDEGRLFEAQRSCRKALEFFETSSSPGKAILCRLLLARIELQNRNCPEALQHCTNAIARLATLEMPILEYQARYVMGQVLSDQGAGDEACAAYQKASESLETLRSKPRKEELKIALIKDKSEVYQRLIEICMSRSGSAALLQAFQYIELAKYRSPAEIILEEVHQAPENISGNSEIVRHLRELREELNWYYHRIEIAQLSSDQNDAARVAQLQIQAREREQAIVHVFQELPEAQPLRRGGLAQLPQVQTTLASGTCLVEYFAVGDQLLAAVLDRDQFEFRPVTLLSRLATLIQKFRAHLGQIPSSAAIPRASGNSHFSLLRNDLRALYTELIEPLLDQISGEHLVLVPHGALHAIPFHALFDGEQYLIDRFTVSSAPSATLFARCANRPVQTGNSSLVLAFGSEKTAAIQQGLSGLADLIKSPQTICGDAAAMNALKQTGQASRWIHIANTSDSRPDRPVAAGLKKAHLNLPEMYQLQLHSELISLCGFGPDLDSDATIAGDACATIARCLLEAGTRSLLLTLWDGKGETGFEYLNCFYSALQSGESKAKAFQRASRELRALDSNGFHWARFALIGDPA